MTSGENSEIIPTSGAYDDNFINYEGFWYTPWYLERVKAVQKEYKAEASDIILCSFQKSGTTWLKTLAFSIMFRAKDKVIKVDSSVNNDTTTTAIHSHHTLENPLLALNPHECVKFLESTSSTSTQNLGLSLLSITKHLNRRLLSTHIPYTSLPKSVFESGCKIVYIYRDPKDVLVSLWHFGRETIPKFQGRTFQEIFEKFCQGKVAYGPIWDHVLGFWMAANERPETVLLLKYEDLKNQTSYCVRKLAEFLDKPFSREEEENNEVEKIIEFCSLEHLGNLEANKKGVCSSMGITVGNNLFFRKGQTGDWKNNLTMEMKERMDTITQDKFNGTSLNFVA